MILERLFARAFWIVDHRNEVLADGVALFGSRDWATESSSIPTIRSKSMTY